MNNGAAYGHFGGELWAVPNGGHLSPSSTSRPFDATSHPPLTHMSSVLCNQFSHGVDDVGQVRGGPDDGNDPQAGNVADVGVSATRFLAPGGPAQTNSSAIGPGEGPAWSGGEGSSAASGLPDGAFAVDPRLTSTESSGFTPGDVWSGFVPRDVAPPSLLAPDTQSISQHPRLNPSGMVQPNLGPKQDETVGLGARAFIASQYDGSDARSTGPIGVAFPQITPSGLDFDASIQAVKHASALEAEVRHLREQVNHLRGQVQYLQQRHLTEHGQDASYALPLPPHGIAEPSTPANPTSFAVPTPPLLALPTYQLKAAAIRSDPKRSLLTNAEYAELVNDSINRARPIATTAEDQQRLGQNWLREWPSKFKRENVVDLDNNKVDLVYADLLREELYLRGYFEDVADKVQKQINFDTAVAFLESEVPELTICPRKGPSAQWKTKYFITKWLPQRREKDDVVRPAARHDTRDTRGKKREAQTPRGESPTPARNTRSRLTLQIPQPGPVLPDSTGSSPLSSVPSSSDGEYLPSPTKRGALQLGAAAASAPTASGSRSKMDSEAYARLAAQNFGI